MVRPEMVTVAERVTANTPTAPWPLTASVPAPGPATVTLLLMVIVLLREMVVQLGVSEKWIVSPGEAWATT